MTNRDKEEIKLVRKVIAKLKRGYGYPCVKKKEDLEPSCVACQAQMTIDFLQKHINLIKSF